MANSYLTSPELARLQNILGFEGLQIFVRPSWGSENSSHREEIHAALQDQSDQVSKTENLRSTSSISHSNGLGGFAFASFQGDPLIQLGFDIEVDLRVTENIAKRICKFPGEFTRAPSPASLWTAKEAAFKALKGPQQPLVVTEFELENWNILDSQFETVQMKDSSRFSFSKNLGVLIKKKPHTFAIFVAFP